MVKIKLTNILNEIQIQSKIPLKVTSKDDFFSNRYHYTFKPFDNLDWFDNCQSSYYRGEDDKVLRSEFLDGDFLENVLVFLSKKGIKYDAPQGAGLNWIEIPNYKNYFINYK